MKDLEELLESIYEDIRTRNTNRGPLSIPESTDFLDDIARRHRLIPFGIPKLMKILADAHRIFSFQIVEADRRHKIRRVEGYVVAEGNVIRDLIDWHGDELVKAYAEEFSMKYSVERIIKEFFPRINKYNNTRLGKEVNIVINLMSCQSTLERNIMQYGSKWQEKQLKMEIEKSDPLSFFLDTADDGPGAGARDAAGEPARRAADAVRYEEIAKYYSKESIEKTLTVYGIEFYTRVCFRDYRFGLVQKLIEEGQISDKDDLATIKKMLQKSRANSDQDLNLQKYAKDINDLEKCINMSLKKG